jgi:16S rRNA (guanine527-N7)-methyltransferase
MTSRRATHSRMTAQKMPNPQSAGPAGSDLSAGEQLGQLLAHASLPPLDPQQTSLFEKYLSLILRWNARTNLTAIRDEYGILSRHFLESIACAHTLPVGIRTLLDFGSGAGFPGIPIAIVHPEIEVTFAESQGKKAAFLQEAVRTLGVQAKIHAGRAEELRSLFECLVLRAVDKMEEAVQAAARLTAPSGWLLLMTTESDRKKLEAAAGREFLWNNPVSIPSGESRIVLVGQRRSNMPA